MLSLPFFAKTVPFLAMLQHMKHWELQFIVEPIVLFAPWVYAGEATL